MVEAEKFGNRGKQALMLLTTKLHVGIDIGDDKATGGLSTYFQNQLFEQSKVKTINDVHGLCVYDDTYPVKFAYVATVTLGIGHNDQNFINIFSECLERDIELSESIRLAFELYSASFFEPTPRARFLTLIMAIEALLDPKPRTKSGQEVVQYLIEHTKQSDLDPPERESLLGSLQWLLQESISKTGRDLSNKYLEGEKYLDKNPKQFFTHCYSLRSQLVHQGKTKDETINFGSLVSELQRFISDLLNKIVDMSITMP